MTITYDDFQKVDIRVGRITRAEPYPEARKPAIKLWVDFGEEIGEKRSSAQITAHYAPDMLVGRQVLAVVNFPPRQIGPFLSQVLTLGFEDAAYPQAARLLQAQRAALSVETAPIAQAAAAQGLKGPQIGEQISKARVKAVAASL